MDLADLFLYFFSIHVITLFLLAFIFTYLIRKMSPSLCYLLWLIVIIKLMVPVGLLEIQTHPKEISPTYLLHDDAIFIEHESFTQSDAQILENTKNDLRRWSLEILLSKKTIYLLIYIMLFFWITTSIAIGIIQLLRFSLFEMRINNMNPIISGRAYQVLYQLTQEANIKYIPRLLSSNEDFSPCSFGLLGGRQIIIVPQYVLDGDEQTLKVILMHELMHARHNDSFVNLLRSICFILFHLHPVRIVADRWFDYYREIARDLEAIRLLNMDRREYVSVMIKYMLFSSERMTKSWASPSFSASYFSRVKRMRFLNSHLDDQNTYKVQIGYFLLAFFLFLCLIHPMPY